jgi:NAD(P)-dependent dehydrogenase (short-subunit alcohol dehydrogenase family)
MANIFAQTPCPAYKISKTMLNMLTVQYSLEYASQGFTIFAISPGVSYSCLFLSDRENVAKFLVVASN